MDSYVKLNHICKNFNHVKALNDASIEAFKGEVLAIVGDNGAGKSTLIKILSGVLRPDSGEIKIGEKSYSSLSVSEALNAGVSTVYQDLALANTLNVTTNIFIGQEITKHGILQKDEMDRQARKLLDDLDVDIPDTAEIAGNLSGGQRQGIAVARLVNRGGNILIFDEPTAAMGVVEASRTLKLIRSLADKGMVVIIICHNLTQVFDTADRVAVMRHGKVLVEKPASESSMHEVVALLTSADKILGDE